MVNGDPEERAGPTPMVTLEKFFKGNDEIRSIGCNLDHDPQPADLYNLLMPMWDRSEVSDIRIQITCMDDPGEQWPFSDTIWIMTSTSSEMVAFWLPAELSRDETWAGWIECERDEPLTITEGHSNTACRYD